MTFSEDESSPTPAPLPADSTRGDLEHEFERVLDLIARCKTGDRVAIDEVIGRYYSRVVRIVRLEMFHSLRNQIEPEEIVNSAMAKAIEKFPEFEYREPASIVNWLARIALNKMRDKRKYYDAECRNAALEVFIDAFSDGLEESRAPFQVAAASAQPPEKAAREEYRFLVYQCLSELSEDHRNVIRWRDYERGSPGYVATRLGRSVGATAMLHERALDALGKKLAAHGVVEP